MSEHSRPFYRVFEQCFGCYNGGCCHYVLYKKYDKPILHFCNIIKERGFRVGELDISHFDREIDYTSNTAIINFEYAYSCAPVKEQQPYISNRPLVDVQEYNTDDIIEELEIYVQSDCWGLYKRNEFHETTFEYFRMANVDGVWTGDTRDDLDYNQIITELEHNETLVVIMGDGFCFYYIKRIGSMFSVTSVE